MHNDTDTAIKNIAYTTRSHVVSSEVRNPKPIISALTIIHCTLSIAHYTLLSTTKVC